ncbi:MAG: phosphatidate cytidylyltransferase [Propionibacterium sp.]|nr:MAG: phosphatidate cytidylyltransferase [Propionibacterium sp.]
MAQTDAKPKKSRAGRNLPAATAVGLGLLITVVLTLAYWNFGFVLFAALALSLGAIELHRVLQKVEMNSAIVPIVVGTVVIVIGSYLAASNPSSGIDSAVFLVVALGLTVVSALVWRMFSGPDGFVKDSAASLFTIGYISLLGAFVGLMIAPADGPARIVTFILCVVGNDVGGYFAGVLFGKHKMAPVISPSKTWEGFTGSIIFGLVIGALSVKYLLGGQLWVGALMGIVLVISATCGDLVESLIKRDLGIKDMSNFLPGHGGVMDRLDSLLVSVPIAWTMLYLLVPTLS